MSDYPKRIKKKLHELRCETHERELTQLAAKFDAWKTGHIGAGDLDHLIHQHHHGPSRELFKFYNDADYDLAVAHASAQGILTKDEIPEVVWPHNTSNVQFLRRD